MIRNIDIKLNAAHPQLPLLEATTFVGSPSAVMIHGVPPSVGAWRINAVRVVATYPDNAAHTVAAVLGAAGTWVATIPATETSGRVAQGLQILADGTDERGESVTGYVLGIAGLAVYSRDMTIESAAGVKYYIHLLDDEPSEPKEGDAYLDGSALNIYHDGAWTEIGGSIELDNTVTRTSTNGVKSSGIWSAIWGALTAVPGFSSLYDWCVAQLAGKASTADATLTPIYSDTPTFSEWTFSDVSDGITNIQQPVFIPSGDEPRWKVVFSYNDITLSTYAYGSTEDAMNLAFSYTDEGFNLHLTATRTRTDIIGYRLGSQSDKPLQPKGDYAPATGIQKSALAQNVQASLDKADTALQTTGGTMTGPLDVNNSISAIEQITIKSRRARYDAVLSIDDEGTVSVSVPNPETGYYYSISFPGKSGYIALLSDLALLAPLASPAFTGTPTAPTPAAGDDSTKVATTEFVKGSLRYDMPSAVALVAENDAATLVCADRAVTNATIAAGFSTLNLTFPEAISGKVRDFYLRIVVAAGESAPALSIPQGITIENPDGAVPEIADGETDAAATTLVWFSETAPNVFTAKSETVKAVA